VKKLFTRYRGRHSSRGLAATGASDGGAAQVTRSTSLRDAVRAVRAVRGFASPYARRLRLVVVLALIGSAASAAAPLLVAQLFDQIAGSRNAGALIAWLTGWLLLALVSAGAIRWRNRVAAEVAARVGRDLRVRLADTTLRAVGKAPNLEVTAISGVEGVTSTIAKVMPTMASGLAGVVVAVAAAGLLDWRVGIVVVLAVGPVIWLCTRVARDSYGPMAAYAKGILRLAAEARRFYQPLGLETVRGLGARPQVLSRATDVADELADAERGRLAVDSWPATQILGALLGIAVVAVSYVIGGISLGALAALFMLTRQQLNELLVLAMWFQQFNDQLPSVKLVQDALEMPTERRGGERIEVPVGRVDLEGVVARYAGSVEPSLNGLSLHLAPGEVVALVGDSGAGKTTLAKLLNGSPGLHVEAGQVLLDGRPVESLDPEHLCTLALRFAQTSLIVDGTLEENLLLPAGADRDDVAEACRVAHLQDVIGKWPSGYETPIADEDGPRVSGGQGQRIGVARGLLRRSARVVVLDEATGALPPAEAGRLLWSLLRWYRSAGRTVLVISHTLPVDPELFERVVVMRNGAVVEDGSPRVLAANPNSAYARLLAARGRNLSRTGQPHRGWSDLGRPVSQIRPPSGEGRVWGAGSGKMVVSSISS
jgi:ABC-type multidrug transport system fused ATPase/permease subunit